MSVSRLVIETPAGVVRERTGDRTRIGKAFDLPKPNTRRIICAPCDAHYKEHERDRWRTRDIAMKPDLGRGLWGQRKDANHIDIDPNQIAVTARTMAGVEFFAELVSIGGSALADVNGLSIDPTILQEGPEAGKHQWTDVVPGLSIQFMRTGHGRIRPCHIIEPAFTLGPGLGTPEFQWRLVVDAEDTWAVDFDKWGIDNGRDLLQREWNPHNQMLEIDKSVTRKLLPDGKVEYVITERWTGRVAHRAQRGGPLAWTADPTAIAWPLRLREFDVSEQIAAGSDDGTETNGTWSSTSDTVIMGRSGGTNWDSGHRWTGIPTVQQGDTISNGQGRVGLIQETGSGTVGTFFGVDEDDAAAFDDTSRQPSNLTPTTANTVISTGQTTGNNWTIDLNDIIQEIVDRPGFGDTIAVVGIDANSNFEIETMAGLERTFGATPWGMFLEFDATSSGGVTGSGSLTASGASAGGSGVSESTGSGAPAAQPSAMSGAGISKSTGTGAPGADAAAAAGSGFSASEGTGAAAAQESAVAGAGESLSTGAGALAAQQPALAGTGVSLSVGAGALAAGAASVIGTEATSVTGAGTLAAAAAAIAGSGVSSSTGAGSAAAQASNAAGAGVSGSAGAGAAAADDAAAVGSGVSQSKGAGALAAFAAAAAGAGRSTSLGAGILQGGDASIVGAGLSKSVGSGALIAQDATIEGNDAPLDSARPGAAGTRAFILYSRTGSVVEAARTRSTISPAETEG